MLTYSDLEIEMALKHRDATDCALVTLPSMTWWNNSAKTDEQKAHIVDRARTLAEGLKLPHDRKLEHARKIIRKTVDSGMSWALSYSGGKDSTVLSHLTVMDMGLRIPHVMSNTRMEYPETMVMVNRWYSMLRKLGVECHTVFPDMRPGEVWKKYGLPLWSKEIAYKYRKFAASKSDRIPDTVPAQYASDFHKAKAAGIRITDQCCDILKKRPIKRFDKANGIKGHLTGVRCAESRIRRLAWIQKGAMYYASTHHHWVANPLAFWTEADVLSYLERNHIKILAPDTCTGGSGCVTCMFGCTSRAREGTPNALQDLKTRNPRMWQTALDKWGYREALDFLEIPYE